MNHQSKIPLPQEIATRLRQLRRRLRRWVLIKGFGRWLLLVLAIIAVDMLIDRNFKMDFAQRLIMLAVMVALAGGLLVWRVIRPLLQRVTDDALLHEIEARHPELNQNLISGAQLARDSDLESKGVSRELAQATIDRSLQFARTMDFQGTFNQKKLAKNTAVLAIGTLLAAALAVGVFQSGFLRTWLNRNLLLANDPWPQATYLRIVGARDGVLTLPRGADHRLLVEVTRDSLVRDVEVTIEIDGPTGQMTHIMKSTGKLDGREHLFVMHNVSAEVTLRARGGDDATLPVAVQLVEPPAILDLQMAAVLPLYTGLPVQPLVGSGPHGVLSGSRIEGTVQVNKPLQKFAVATESASIDLTPGQQPLQYRLELPGPRNELAGGKYEFKLMDETGLGSVRSGSFVINIREDGPPKVLASLLGIHGLAVPRARVPVSCNVVDEYGLRSVAFHCNWNNSEQENPPDSPGSQVLPIKSFADGEDATRQFQDVAVLDLEPLGLQVGTSFRMLVRATDSRPDQPNSADSSEFLLRIVSETELREDLLRREIEQRKAFDRAYEAQLELLAELQAVAAMQPTDPNQEAFESDRQSRMIALARDQKLIGTNIDAIANRFEEYLVEAKNNRLDEEEGGIVGVQTMADRFDNQIIRPIRVLDSELIQLANRNLENCRRLLGNQSELADAVGQTTEIQQAILDEMRRIMASMVDSENFQEVINKLLDIKRGESQIKAEIKKRKPGDTPLIDEDDIFDDD